MFLERETPHMSNAAVQTASPPNEAFRTQLLKMDREFALALPAHIPKERFMRVVLTAVNASPDLLTANRRSLFESAMKAAQDGLLPDGREGAFVVYRTKEKFENARGVLEERWIQKVQWMPMIAGILKKVRNSGEISTIVARVVYAGDKFRHWIDDDGEHIEFEASDDHDNSVVRKVFAMAKLKDGSIEVEALTPADIEKIRNVSRAKDNGPWVDWWDEMAKKSALRRLAKRLPLSSDADDLIRRDDELYDLKSGDSETQMNALLAPRQDPFADEDDGGRAAADLNTEDTGTDAPAPDSGASQAAGEVAGGEPCAATATPAADPPPVASKWFGEGARAADKGMSRKAMPPELRGNDRSDDASEWLRGYDSRRGASE